MSTPKLSKQVVRALEAAWEAAGGQKLSADAAALVIGDLSRYPEVAVLKAITRAAREVTGRMSLAAIIERIDDGRPTAEEAWGMVGTTDENETVVCTSEAIEARAACGHLLGTDRYASRLAFEGRYEALVREARGRGTPPQWIASLGQDRARRQGVLARAVQEGRLSAGYAAELLGVPEGELTGRPSIPAIPAGERRPVAQIVGQVAKRSGPPPCSPVCDGWRHADGSRCPRWP